jgi:hypothetical protein
LLAGILPSFSKIFVSIAVLESNANLSEAVEFIATMAYFYHNEPSREAILAGFTGASNKKRQPSVCGQWAGKSVRVR